MAAFALNNNNINWRTNDLGKIVLQTFSPFGLSLLSSVGWGWGCSTALNSFILCVQHEVCMWLLCTKTCIGSEEGAAYTLGTRMETSESALGGTFLLSDAPAETWSREEHEHEAESNLYSTPVTEQTLQS